MQFFTPEQFELLWVSSGLLCIAITLAKKNSIRKVNHWIYSVTLFFCSSIFWLDAIVLAHGTKMFYSQEGGVQTLSLIYNSSASGTVDLFWIIIAILFSISLGLISTITNLLVSKKDPVN